MRSARRWAGPVFVLLLLIPWLVSGSGFSGGGTGATGVTGATGPTGATGATGATGPSSGLAIYGDGKDGVINITASNTTLPSLSGVSTWQATTAYSVGDRVKSTGTNVRSYRCIAAGTSGGSEPWNDFAPGSYQRGFQFRDDTGGLGWVQETFVIDNTLEDFIYATTFTLANGVTVLTYGSLIRATTSITINGTLTGTFPQGSVVGDDNDPPPFRNGLYVAGLGYGSGFQQGMLSPAGTASGRSGWSLDGPGQSATFTKSNVSPHFSGRRVPRSLADIIGFSYQTMVDPVGPNLPTIGAGGRNGSDDSTAGKLGGLGGPSGSAVGLAAPLITIGASGTIIGNGTAGGTGQTAGMTGGGAGGSGGYVYAITNTYANWIPGTNVTAVGGAGGSGGTISFAITAAAADPVNTVTITGDQTAYCTALGTNSFTISGSTGNNGTYTIASCVFGAATVITTNEPLASSVGDGNVNMTGGSGTAGLDGEVITVQN